MSEGQYQLFTTDKNEKNKCLVQQWNTSYTKILCLCCTAEIFFEAMNKDDISSSLQWNGIGSILVKEIAWNIVKRNLFFVLSYAK